MAQNNTRRNDNNVNDNDVNDNDVEEEIDDDIDLRESRVGRSGQWGDPTEAPIVEVSFEEILELQDELDENDPLMGDLRDTAHTDGSTEDPELAQEQGLVYMPPLDPPVVPSDGLQNVEMAAGFAPSIEEEPFITNMPRGSRDDSDLEEEIRRALRYNSGTTTLEDVRVYVRDGIAYLRGKVLDDDDSAIVEEFIRDLDVVDDIRNELETAY